MNTEVTHYPNGNIKSIEVFNDKGKRHNPDGPAIQGWYENGQEEYREFYIDGKENNPDGPAWQGWYENGQEYYRAFYIDGKLLSESKFNQYTKYKGKTIAERFFEKWKGKKICNEVNYPFIKWFEIRKKNANNTVQINMIDKQENRNENDVFIIRDEELDNYSEYKEPTYRAFKNEEHEEAWEYLKGKEIRSKKGNSIFIANDGFEDARCDWYINGIDFYDLFDNYEVLMNGVWKVIGKTEELDKL